MIASKDLSAKLEPFDSFWEAPDDIEGGYSKFYKFYKHNYAEYLPAHKDAKILVISCGPGYFLNLLSKLGYKDALGIDSNTTKLEFAKKRGFNCEAARAFEYLSDKHEAYDLIFCEQEINHLTKSEMGIFLELCHKSLKQNGKIIIHSLNGANPITGPEALTQNIDHFNALTEYSVKQVLVSANFSTPHVFPLNLYVFFLNPLNYILIIIATLYHLFFRFSFILYGKSNKLFTKKIGAVSEKTTPSPALG
jgi:SAM-dependent methyltransferase